ncbi:probable protein ABIL5 [Dioscorea cayenensis subsp. rotundata]|uniref:Probable protein ABIL5 n=1 Tax=Dioscorea cayennensis subsp. rotundata TaxID=55577 RepID=A0AB40CHE4_DIOCR|nr:probable protein ABIL5 [Dioscorea cayenensis subsp. rotundata]
MEDKGEKKKENKIEPINYNDADDLKKSLQELKELRSQLHNAADHCETLFLKAKQKKIVMENTKSYLCQAIVTVIDHLGTVSSKLEQRMLTAIHLDILPAHSTSL